VCKAVERELAEGHDDKRRQTRHTGASSWLDASNAPKALPHGSTRTNCRVATAFALRVRLLTTAHSPESFSRRLLHPRTFRPQRGSALRRTVPVFRANVVHARDDDTAAWQDIKGIGDIPPAREIYPPTPAALCSSCSHSSCARPPHARRLSSSARPARQACLARTRSPRSRRSRTTRRRRTARLRRCSRGTAEVRVSVVHGGEEADRS
jgi:hypothetical protein